MGIFHTAPNSFSPLSQATGVLNCKHAPLFCFPNALQLINMLMVLRCIALPLWLTSYSTSGTYHRRIYRVNFELLLHSPPARRS